MLISGHLTEMTIFEVISAVADSAQRECGRPIRAQISLRRRQTGRGSGEFRKVTRHPPRRSRKRRSAHRALAASRRSHPYTPSCTGWWCANRHRRAANAYRRRALSAPGKLPGDHPRAKHFSSISHAA